MHYIMTKDEDDKLLRDGERIRVPMFAMDASTVLDDGLPEGVHRPGYR